MHCRVEVKSENVGLWLRELGEEGQEHLDHFESRIAFLSEGTTECATFPPFPLVCRVFQEAECYVCWS